MILKTSFRFAVRFVLFSLPFSLSLLAGTLGYEAVSGCISSASAPPVSLPAPVTGRLTVTSPDETGVALVVGDDGAVPPNSLVHVANATQDTTAFRGLELLLGVIPSAYAQSSLPSICSRTFHTCALADANGSFEASIPASDDHDLIIEVIDNGGHRISDRVHRSVPHNIKFFSRPVAGLGLLDNTVSGDHTLYVLMGHTDTAPNGLVSVVNLDTQERTVVPFDGPQPARIAVDQTTRRAVVVDPIGNFAARVDLSTNGFDAPTKLSIGTPRDVIITSSGAAAVVATAETADGGIAADARFLRSVALSAFTEADPIRMSFLQAFIPGATNIETKALDHVNHGSGPAIDLGAFVGIYDVSGTPTPALGLFDAAAMTLLTAIALPPGTVPEDVAFIKDSGRILVADSATNQILDFDFIVNVAEQTITPAGAIADPNGFLLKPREITVSPDGNFAFVTAKNGTETHPDTVLTVDLTADQIVKINAIGFGPKGSVFDPVTQDLFLGSQKSHSVTFLGLPDLIP